MNELMVNFRSLRNGQATLYCCSDINGFTYFFRPQELKSMINAGVVKLLNMKINSNGALAYNQEMMKLYPNIEIYDKDLENSLFTHSVKYDTLRYEILQHKVVCGRPITDVEVINEAHPKPILLNNNLALCSYTKFICKNRNETIANFYMQYNTQEEYWLNFAEVYKVELNQFPNPKSIITYSEFDRGVARFVGMDKLNGTSFLRAVSNFNPLVGAAPKLIPFDYQNITPDIYNNTNFNRDLTSIYRVENNKNISMMHRSCGGYQHISSLMIENNMHTENSKVESAKPTNKGENIPFANRTTNKKGILGLMDLFKR